MNESTLTRTVLRYPLTEFTTEGDIDIATIKVPASPRPAPPFLMQAGVDTIPSAEVVKVGRGTSERICAWVEHDDVRYLVNPDAPEEGTDIPADTPMADLRFAFIPTGSVVPDGGEYQSTVVMPSFDSGIRHVYLLP